MSHLLKKISSHGLPLLFALVILISLVGVQPAQEALAQTVITADFEWVAYNDLDWESPQPETKITKYTIEGSTSGKLVRYDTGAQTNVNVAVTESGVQGYSGGNEYDGSEAALGTDAYTTFHGIVDSTGLIVYGSDSTWYVDLTFTGLDPAKTYSFATTANRNRNEADYISRVSRFTISDIDSATNASTSGVTVIDPSQVAFSTGYNTVNGYVARWTAIQPGSDGDFKVRVQAHSGNKAYGPSVFMLAEEAPSEFTVTFDANGGTGTMDAQTAGEPTALTLNTFTRMGYTFDGWNTAADGSGTPYADGAEYSFAADITLYAQWAAKTFTVFFDANGGTTPVPASKIVTYDAAYGDLAVTTRVAHNFLGWFTTASGGTEVKAADIVTVAADQTLYAHWQTFNIYLPLVLK